MPRQLSHSLSRGSCSEARDVLPHCSCVIAGGSLGLGDRHGLKILFPNALQLQTHYLKFILVIGLHRENRRLKILCTNASMICKASNINLPQSQFCMHKMKKSGDCNLGGWATPLPPHFAFWTHCYLCCLTYMIRSSDSYRINLFFSRTSLNHSCKSCASSCVPESA